jgi:uncharacterized damage-inducible protein DinB
LHIAVRKNCSHNSLVANSSEALRQFIIGVDFWSIRDLTGDLTAEQACARAEGAPYSIATQLGHALFWQERWLAELRGETLNEEYSEEEDFPQISPEDWPRLRSRYLEGLTEAREGSDNHAQHLISQIAVHGSYHAGQIALLRRLSGFGYPPRVTD